MFVFVLGGWLVRTSFLVELAEHFSDDLPHALQRLEVILGLVELLLGVLHLIAELTNPRVELLFVWCGSRRSVGRSVGGVATSQIFFRALKKPDADLKRTGGDGDAAPMVAGAEGVR